MLKKDRKWMVDFPNPHFQTQEDLAASKTNKCRDQDNWTLPFTSLDQPDEFHVSDRLTVNVSMMHRQGYDIRFGTYE